MKNIVLLLSLISFSLYAQEDTIERKIKSDVDFYNLSNKSIEFFTSEEYLKFKDDKDDFFNKINNDFFKDNPRDFNRWITENLSKTKFNSIEEATKDYNNYIELRNKFKPEESKISENLNLLRDKYGDVVYEVYKNDVENIIIGILYEKKRNKEKL